MVTVLALGRVLDMQLVSSELKEAFEFFFGLFHFQDWLLDRRHCEVRWQTAVFQIREKINVAIQDMPPVDEITQLLSGTCELFSLLITSLSPSQRLSLVSVVLSN